MSILFGIPVAVVLVAAYFVYDRRYHGKSATGLRPTSEVFLDPTTGKRMRVYENPSTGAREYMSDDD
jgi:hypothetical protein